MLDTSLRIIIILLDILVEGVLSEKVETGKRRGLVGDGVVHATEAGAHHILVTGDVRPTRGERGNLAAEETVAAVAGSEFALTAHAEFAEVAANVKQSFTVEKAAFSGELTVIGVEAVFERETDLEAVAEVFFTLHAEAAGGVLAGAHVELINVFAIALVRGGVAEARVDDAVHRDIGGKGGTGEGAENGDSGESLLEHDLFPH